MAEPLTPPRAQGPPPGRTPLIDARGLMTRAWVTWCYQVWERLGGPSAPSNAALAEALAGTMAALEATHAALVTTQAALTTTQASLTATQAAVTLLETAVDTVQTALATVTSDLATAVGRTGALEAHLAAIVAAVPVALTDSSGGTATNALQFVAALGATPATAQILRDDLQGNIWPVLKNNYSDLAATVNALRTALLAT